MRTKYNIGDVVYAIRNTTNKDEFFNNHCKIFKVVVDSINIDSDGENYIMFINNILNF